MSQSYHEQFRENRRNKIQNDLFSSSKATTGGKLPAQRPTAVVKQPLRSDTFTLPKKRGETNYYVPKIDQSRNVSQRLTNKKPAILNSSSTTGQKRPTETMRKDDGGRTMLTKPTSIIDRRNLERKPVRFANESDNTYYSYSPAPTPASDSSSVYHQKSATLANPSPQDALDESRRTRVVNDAYVVHRRRDSPAYVYSNYHTDNPVDSTRTRQEVRAVRDSQYREIDDSYYVESEPRRVIYEQPAHRTAFIRRPPPATEYVYVDESPSTLIRHRRPHRSEVVYIEDDEPSEYEEEIVYVDDNGNEIEYTYHDEPIYHGRNYKKSYQPSTTNIVYE